MITETLSQKESIIALIEGILQSILCESSKIQSQQPNIFNSKGVPSITISSYIRRIESLAHCSPNIFICALILLDRYQEYSGIMISLKSIHRLLLTSFVVAVKTFDDFYFKNSYYSKIGGISLQQLNNLEKQFLLILNFNVNIDSSTFQSYADRLSLYQKLDNVH